jgi:hypothetical protein
MPHRVSPTLRVRGHIDELFAQDRGFRRSWRRLPGSARSC